MVSTQLRPRKPKKKKKAKPASHRDAPVTRHLNDHDDLESRFLMIMIIMIMIMIIVMILIYMMLVTSSW